MMWLLCVRKVRALRTDPTNQGLRTLCYFFFAAGIVYTLATPFIYMTIDRLTRIPNLSILPCYVAGLVTIALQQVMLTYWAYPSDQVRSRVRRRIVVLTLAVTAMTVAFFAAPPLNSGGERPADFDGYYASVTGAA